MTQLGDAARALIRPGRRTILGITGPPAAGKSTLAAALAQELDAPVVGMDGFHLAQAELERLGRAERKGAPDTIDRAGYRALLARIRAGAETVYAPEFRREIEEPVAGAVAVPADAPLVLTEGNYLLHWPEVAALLDAVWFVDLDEPTRLRRLVARHVVHGRTEQEARARAAGSDQSNAALIEATRPRADRIVTP